MAFNQTEKEIIQFGQSNGKSQTDILKALAKYRAGQKPIQPQPAPEPTALQETSVDLLETGAGIVDEFKQAGENIVDTAQDENLSFFEKARGIGAEAFRRGARAVGEGVIGIGKTLLPQKAEDAISGKVQDVAQAIAQTGVAQDVMEKYNSLSPDAKRDVDNALGFAEGLGEIATGGALSRAGKATVESTINAASFGLKSSGKLVERLTPQSVKNLHTSLNPQNREEAVKALTETYTSSMVENRQAINNKLEKLAASNSFGDKTIKRDDLIRNLAEEGIIPEVEGRLAKFNKSFDELATLKQAEMDKIDPILRVLPTKTSLDELQSQAETILKNSPQVGANLNQSIAELDRFFASYKTKFGDTVSPLEVNLIRKDMNRVTKSFKDADLFMQDTADAVADAARNRLDTLVPSGEVRTANKEWARLHTLEKTAKVLHNQQIDVGLVGRALGSYASTIAASGLGLSVGGPGGLVIAGIVAHYGGDAMADFLRKAKFSDELRNIIVGNIANDPDMVLDLTKSASKENKTFLQSVFDKAKQINKEGQIGLSTKDISSTPEAVAKRISAEDKDIIERFLDDPNSLDRFLEISPILQGMKIDHAEPKVILRFLKEVLAESRARLLRLKLDELTATKSQ